MRIDISDLLDKSERKKDMKNKSIEFLLNHSGPVIQYRLRKEIIGNISAQEEKQFLHKIYELPYMRLIQKYVKPNGYIGSGMHSWDNWRGTVLHETPLQDGETAARLLCYYAIPKEHPIVADFVKAMRDEKTMNLEEILKKRGGVEKKYKLPYLESDEYFPNGYTLETLAYTRAWRTEKNVRMLADALNHINKIMKPDNQMHVKVKSRYYAP